MADQLIVPPADPREAAQAKRALDALRRHETVAVGSESAPASAVSALERALEALAGGGGVAVLPLDAEVRTQTAADLLGVSRPTLVKLLESGAIPFRSTGSHRRLRIADILTYRRHWEEERRALLDEIAVENQRLGLYDD